VGGKRVQVDGTQGNYLTGDQEPMSMEFVGCEEHRVLTVEAAGLQTKE